MAPGTVPPRRPKGIHLVGEIGRGVRRIDAEIARGKAAIPFGAARLVRVTIFMTLAWDDERGVKLVAQQAPTKDKAGRAHPNDMCKHTSASQSVERVRNGRSSLHRIHQGPVRHVARPQCDGSNTCAQWPRFPSSSNTRPRYAQAAQNARVTCSPACVPSIGCVRVSRSVMGRVIGTFERASDCPLLPGTSVTTSRRRFVVRADRVYCPGVNQGGDQWYRPGLGPGRILSDVLLGPRSTFQGVGMSVQSALASISLSNTTGEQIRLGSLWEARPAVLVFVRHYG